MGIETEVQAKESLPPRGQMRDKRRYSSIGANPGRDLSAHGIPSVQCHCVTLRIWAGQPVSRLLNLRSILPHANSCAEVAQ